MSEPSWVTHAVWWHVYPLGFTGAPPNRPPDDATRESERGQHRLARLEKWLDYAVQLGASGLMLAPVFESNSHGYDTIDYTHVDARLGDDGDLDAIFVAAHARGLRVVLDGVFNHVGRGFPHDWFVPAGDDYELFEGHPGLVTLDHDRPEVILFVTDVMTHWLDRGADGWRLDAAYATPPAFWARVLPAVREKHPDAYIFGEVIHGDYPQIVEAGQLDAVTQYELWKAIWSSINDQNLFELGWALERHNGYLESFVPLTFIGNHDVTRIASKIGETAHLAHALVVLLTVGGTPAIYYGDEQAFRGVKEERVGGDDAIRPAYPDGPEELSALGQPFYRLHQDLIGLRRRHSWLHRARTRKLDLQNRLFVYEVFDDANRLCVALNLDDAPAAVAVPSWVGEVLVTGTSTGSDPARLAGSGLTVPAHGWAVLG